MSNQEWRTAAICQQVDNEMFYPANAGEANLPKKVCRRCPVRTACLVDALNEERGLGVHHRFGVRGGLSATERYNLAVRSGEPIREGGNGQPNPALENAA